MDTKLKSRLMIIAWLLLFTFGLSGINSLLGNANRYMQSYFHSRQFHYQLNQYTSYLDTYKLNWMTEQEAKAALTVTEAEIIDYHLNHNSPGVAQELSDAKKNEIKAKILKRKKQQLDSYYQKIKQNRPEFADLQSSFQYYLKDTQTGTVYTDMDIKKNQSPDDYLKGHKMAFVHRYSSTNDMSAQQQSVLFKKETNSYTGIIAVPESLPASSVIATESKNYRHQRIAYFVYTICGIIAFVISLLIYKRVSVFEFAENEQWERFYNRVPADVCLAVFLIIGSIAYTNIIDTNLFYYYTSLIQGLETLAFNAIFLALTLLQAKFLYSRLKNPDGLKKEWENCMVHKISTGIGDVFLNRSTALQMMLFLGVIAASGFGIMVVFVEPGAMVLYVPLFFIVTVPVLFIIFKRVGYFNRILDNTSRLVLGNVEPDLPVKGGTALATLAANVNTLKHGVETSQAEQAKSERFKTELITNVSHDLRTPLTSIITYTELLKTPELSGEDQDAYIEIIDRKSKRLKVLIEDLFEASKMASGSIELVKEKVDLTQLLQQALAENDERINESSLQFRVAKPDAPVYCVVDGQKLWRVFDNLIGNILKYSMDQTRVFIAIKKVQDQAVITFKNITKYELSENIDELFERFKRGDESRHTDGSGLGLAIAKSIVDLHGGDLDIEVDGDLFKVTVSLKAEIL